MIERFALYEIDKLRDTYSLPIGVPAGVKKNYNTSPTQQSPVVLIRDGKRVIERMDWGFVPDGAKDTNSVFRYKTFTAKAEGIFSKPKWQTAIRSTRCIVPMNGYFEWVQLPEGKRPFFVHKKNNELFSVAGIYSSWTDADGKARGMFSVVTAVIDQTIGSKRSPIVIAPNDEATWLDSNIDDVNDLYGLMLPPNPKEFDRHMVTSDLKNVKLNDPRVLAAV